MQKKMPMDMCSLWLIGSFGSSWILRCVLRKIQVDMIFGHPEPLLAGRSANTVQFRFDTQAGPFKVTLSPATVLKVDPSAVCHLLRFRRLQPSVTAWCQIFDIPCVVMLTRLCYVAQTKLLGCQQGFQGGRGGGALSIL